MLLYASVLICKVYLARLQLENISQVIDLIINTTKKEAGGNSANNYSSITTSASAEVIATMKAEEKYFMTSCKLSDRMMVDFLAVPSRGNS